MPGADAYATSKQCLLAAAMTFARETPRLRINAIEPGFTPNTGLARDANAFLRFLANFLLPLIAPPSNIGALRREPRAWRPRF